MIEWLEAEIYVIYLNIFIQRNGFLFCRIHFSRRRHIKEMRILNRRRRGKNGKRIRFKGR
jgi:hypothetical protein